MNVKPIKNKLIVEIIKVEDTVSKGGIILTNKILDKEENPHDTLRGRVVAAGKNNDNIKKNDIIFFEQRYSSPVFNNNYKTIKSFDILGKEDKDEN